jgi:hypothetical protein
MTETFEDLKAELARVEASREVWKARRKQAEVDCDAAQGEVDRAADVLADARKEQRRLEDVLAGVITLQSVTERLYRDALMRVNVEIPE